MKVLTIFALVLGLGLLVPSQGAIPVQGASHKDWAANSFWYAPWGKSGVHKGIDIFAPKGGRVIASTSGLVVFTGNIDMGGNVVAILGPKWRIHYYAHLDSINAKPWDFAGQGDIIGKVGNTGNAAGKPPHLHYSVLSLVPYMWNISTEQQGWKRMFYMHPAKGFKA